MYNDLSGRANRYRRPMKMNHGYGMRPESADRGNAVPMSLGAGDRKFPQERADMPGGDPTQNNDCTMTGWGIHEHPLSMVYAPYQIWRNIYKEDTALSRGTLFSELDLPFEGKNCK